MKNIHSVLALLAALSVSACSGAGTTTPMVPQTQQSVAKSPTQARTAANSNRGKSDHDTFTLFGDATLIHPGEDSKTAVQLIWSPSQPFGGVDFSIPANLTVGQLNNLSTDFKFTQGTCSQGSPRFQINVNGGNVFVYLGPQFPSVTNPCAGATYSNSTNVIGPASLVDATQVGGTYETWSAFQASNGSAPVTGIQLVVDGFTTPYITAQFDNTQINADVFTYDHGNGHDHD